jgi:hypothetical protein
MRRRGRTHVTGWGSLYHLCRDHDSWKAWSLDVMARVFGTQAQGSYYGLEGADLAVGSHRVS